jgi:hypothetical protein
MSNESCTKKCKSAYPPSNAGRCRQDPTMTIETRDTPLMGNKARMQAFLERLENVLKGRS